MRRPAIVLIALAVLSLLTGAGTAQEKQSPSTAPTGLALQVVFVKDRPPAYLQVPGADAKPSGGWYAWFERIPSWQPPAGSQPVEAVNICSRVEGDAVQIKVSVFLDEKLDKEAAVATYLAHPNEKIVVRELMGFGVVPFEITVVRITPRATVLPAIENRTNSIQVASLEPNVSTLPSYKLSLRNLSTKNVVAMEINIFQGNRKRITRQPHSREGEPLIAAGALYETIQMSAYTASQSPGGYTPENSSDQRVVIRTIVFDDGTYEGEAAPAAQIRARNTGQKIQLARVTALLKNALESSAQSSPAIVESLKGQISSLTDEVEKSVINALLKDFPGLDQQTRSDLKVSFQVGMHTIKKELLDEIGRFEKAAARSADINAFRTWLGATREKYEKWLSRL